MKTLTNLVNRKDSAKDAADKEDAKTRIEVFVRIRPLIEGESCIEKVDEEEKSLIIRKDFEQRRFRFSQVFTGVASQNEVFDRTARSIVESVMIGYNGCIMAYGQTGTGKTHTILGKRDGQLPQSQLYLFDNSQDSEFIFEISCLQIYMETLTDLFDPQNQNLQLREKQGGFNVANSKWIRIRNLEDSLRIIEYAENRRLSSSTYMNAYSSRSHAIFILKVINSKTMTSSNLFLVDLAGSERIKKSQAQGDRLEEAISINSSLMALSKCIYGISENKSQHIPFRESKLTKLLQETLSGNSKNAIVITISPDNLDTDESMSSLKFGQRAAKVYCAPKICRIQESDHNQHMDYLNDELSHLYRANEDLKNENRILLEKLQNNENNSNNCKGSARSDGQEVMRACLTVKPQSLGNHADDHRSSSFKKIGKAANKLEENSHGYAMPMSRSTGPRPILANIENTINYDEKFEFGGNGSPMKNRMSQLEKENEDLKEKLEAIEMTTFEKQKKTFDNVEDKLLNEIDQLKTSNSKLQLNQYKHENEMGNLRVNLQSKDKKIADLETELGNMSNLNGISNTQWCDLGIELHQILSYSKKEFYELHNHENGRNDYDKTYEKMLLSIKNLVEKFNKQNEKSKSDISGKGSDKSRSNSTQNQSGINNLSHYNSNEVNDSCIKTNERKNSKTTGSELACELHQNEKDEQRNRVHIFTESLIKKSIGNVLDDTNASFIGGSTDKSSPKVSDVKYQYGSRNCILDKQSSSKVANPCSSFIIEQLDNVFKGDLLANLEKEFKVSDNTVMNYAYEEVFGRLVEFINENLYLKNDLTNLQAFKAIIHKSIRQEDYGFYISDYLRKNCAARKIQKMVRSFINRKRFCQRKNDISASGYFQKVKAGIGKELLQLLFNNVEECVKTIDSNVICENSPMNNFK